MADPLSIVAGVAGLVKASYGISRLLTNFIGSMKSASSKADIAVNEITETRTILEHLQSFILRFETADKSRRALVQVDRLVDVISGCVATFSEFEAALDKVTRSSMTLLGRAKWAVWDEEEIDDFVMRLQRHKCSLTLLVVTLTGETQLAIWNLMEQRNVAAEMSHAATLQSSYSADNESLTSQKTIGRHEGLKSDTSTRNLRGPNLIRRKPLAFHREFELELKSSRPYRAINLEARTSTISLAESNLRGWSILSGYSLAEVSNLSVISLNISISDVHNPIHYDTTVSDIIDDGDSDVFPRLPNPNPSSIMSHTGDMSEKHSTLLGSMWFSPSGSKQPWWPVDEVLQEQALKLNEEGPKPAVVNHQDDAHNTYDDSVVDAGNCFLRRSLATKNYHHTAYISEGNPYQVDSLPSKVEVFFNHGLLCDDQNSLMAAESIYRRALADMEKVLGPEQERTLDTIQKLGVIYAKQDDLLKAEAMFQWARDGYEKILGLEYQSTLNSIYWLGRVYNKQDKLVEAEVMFKWAMDGYEKALGPHHESTLISISWLGRVHDKLERSKAMFQRGGEKVVGPQYESTPNSV